MKRDNRLLKFTVLVLLLTMLAMILVSGTYAKYTSTAMGVDTATVAKWSIQVNGKEIAVSGDPQTLSFNLFDTIKDSDSNDENDVADGLIAPGTSGSFALEVKNASEVTASYTIGLALTNDNNVPLEFSTDGGVSWAETLSVSSAKTIAINATDTTTVQWRWAFDGDDTALGIAAQTASSVPSVTVTTTITATQVD